MPVIRTPERTAPEFRDEGNNTAVLPMDVVLAPAADLRVTSVVRARVTVGGAGVGEVGPGQPLLFPWREGEDEVQLTAVESGARSTVRVRVRAGQVTSVSCTRSPEFVCTGG